MLPLALVPLAATAQDRNASHTTYGTTGLIEMPSAVSAPDGQIAGTVAMLGGQSRTTLSFQLSPRLSASVRFGSIEAFRGPETDTFYARGLDLRYRIVDEKGAMPAIAVGLQDFLGNGVHSAEYVVATKVLTDSIRVSAGLGWGRFGSRDGFDNPLGVLNDRLESRPADDFSDDGSIGADRFFRGDAALFGGIEYALNDRFTFKAEYSSDSYDDPAGADRGIDGTSPFSYGVAYTPLPGLKLGLSWLHGTELAFTGTITLNPNDRPFDGGLDAPPLPVAPRGTATQAAATVPQSDVIENLRRALGGEGMRLHSAEIAATSARIRYTNTRYRAEAQALGRAARVASRELPPGVETIILEPMQRGIPLSSSTFRRSDIERFENVAGGSAAMHDRAVLADAGGEAGLIAATDTRNAFGWGLSPYLRITVPGGGAPEVDLGVELSGRYEIRPDLVLSGALSKRLTGSDLDDALPVDPDAVPGVPVVRRDSAIYSREGDPGLARLTLAHFSRPGPDLYGRVTVGYLERMFGGVSTELLWKPVDSPLGLGLELNAVRQRDYDMQLGFRDYETVTGHVSAYYDMENGLNARLDVGRYLAGDWGATLALDREFANGWTVGAYVTRTDVSPEDFGSGGYSRGISFTVPTDFIFGKPTRREVTTGLADVSGDGGARLDVDGRLYDIVRGGHANDLDDGWGRFWR